MTRTEIVMQAMTHDELDALIRDAEAERERRKVKPCVRRMEDGIEDPELISELCIDGCNVADVWTEGCKQLNIDHATAKRQIALAFCWADWGARVNTFGLDIPPGHPLAWQFIWLTGESTDGNQVPLATEAARAVGWIK